MLQAGSAPEVEAEAEPAPEVEAGAEGADGGSGGVGEERQKPPPPTTLKLAVQRWQEAVPAEGMPELPFRWLDGLDPDLSAKAHWYSQNTLGEERAARAHFILRFDLHAPLPTHLLEFILYAASQVL